MKPLLTTRWPVFELSIFLVVVLIGWAEFQLWTVVKPQVIETQSELQGEKSLVRKWEQNASELQRTVHGLQQTVNALSLESNETRKIFADLTNAFQGEIEELHKTRLEDARTLPDVQRIQDEYLSIGDAVATNIDQLQG